jgi:hypothetical protein
MNAVIRANPKRMVKAGIFKSAPEGGPGRMGGAEGSAQDKTKK